MMEDFAGMTDREILIAVATRQQSMNQDFLKFMDAQALCNISIGDRVYNLELNGSKVSRDTASSLLILEKRICIIELEMGSTVRETAATARAVASEHTKLSERVNYLEVNGAKISQQNKVDIEKMDGRVTTIERNCNSETEVTAAKGKLMDNIWVKIVTGVGAAAGFASLVKWIFFSGS